MKKALMMLVATVLTFSMLFVGCSSKNEGSNGNTEGTKTEAGKTEEKKYQYYTPEQVKDIVENNKPAILLDIQVKDDFDKHHIKGAIPTYAYPAKTAEDTAKLDTVLDKLNASKDPIVVICPGGAGGATRSIDYLKTKGVDASRLFILEKGQSKWPYDELLEK